jgi:hypothetical protein
MGRKLAYTGWQQTALHHPPIIAMRSPILSSELFDAISSNRDLDDPAERFLAQKFMIEALFRVTGQLPQVAQAAAVVANRFSTGVASVEEVIGERVRLWNAIHGSDQSTEPEVLKIRTAICVLHPNDIDGPADTLEYFLAFWERGGLGMNELRLAAENNYAIPADLQPWSVRHRLLWVGSGRS